MKKAFLVDEETVVAKIVKDIKHKLHINKTYSNSDSITLYLEAGEAIVVANCLIENHLNDEDFLEFDSGDNK